MSSKPSGMSLGQHRHQRGRRDELHVVILADRLAAEADGKMRLARSGRPQEQKRVTVRDPAAGRKLPDLLLIQRRLRLVVEAVQFAHEGELGELAMPGRLFYFKVGSRRPLRPAHCQRDSAASLASASGRWARPHAAFDGGWPQEVQRQE